MNLEDSLVLFGLPNLEGQTDDTLKKRYHHLAQKYHPDKGGSTEDFISLRKAYIYLRTSLIDPTKKSRSSTSDQKYQNEKAYYSNQYNQNYNNSTTQANKQSQENHFSNKGPVTNPYQEAYSKAVEQIKQYEEIFNAQIRIINNTNKRISDGYSDYFVRRNNLEKALNSYVAELDKKYHRQWWEYVIPVPKLDKEFYTKQYNVYIQSYNEELKNIDEEYIQGLLSTYQISFEKIIDYLK